MLKENAGLLYAGVLIAPDIEIRSRRAPVTRAEIQVSRPLISGEQSLIAHRHNRSVAAGPDLGGLIGSLIFGLVRQITVYVSQIAQGRSPLTENLFNCELIFELDLEIIAARREHYRR